MPGSSDLHGMPEHWHANAGRAKSRSGRLNTVTVVDQAGTAQGLSRCQVLAVMLTVRLAEQHLTGCF